MSEINHRTNNKKYDKRLTERKGCSEVLYDDGWLIPECDIKYKRKSDRKKTRRCGKKICHDAKSEIVEIEHID